MTKTSTLIKQMICTLVLMLSAWTIQAQNNVGIGTTSPASSAKLEVNSTTQGMLIPRMTSAQRITISSPATGLMVYQTDGAAGFYFYNGGGWVSLSSYTLPSQSGNSGKVLKTDGSNATWQDAVTTEAVRFYICVAGIFPTYDDLAYESHSMGEIIMHGGSFNSTGSWLPCNGQILSIAQNQALFAILGTTYGGNGQTTFALPNLNNPSKIPTGR
ncbi:phage tail protein [Edaphocola flava]|jgi:microcystin-dependent protein|uniref:phage tail protein n=1 Tax=Edaphocola flava TaxID=2499629 RepID=UPI001F1B53DD|nr:phage tail protein [Edaphocola flava]